MNSGEFDTDEAISLLRDAAQAMRSPATSPADEVRAIHVAVNALQAREADLLAMMDATRAHEAEGAASVRTWAVREIRQDPSTTRQLVRASRTMRDLPSFGAAARAGTLSFEHVNAMTYALKHVGHAETVDIEAELLDVATTHTPAELFALVRRFKAVVHEDDLDEAWLRGMDKQDLSCVQCGDGYQPGGFLPIDVGAKYRAFLAAASVPIDGDDLRTCAQRRVEAFDQLLSRAFETDLPGFATKGAQVSVIVNGESLKDALTNAQHEAVGQSVDLDAEPAVLEGFGPIGPALLAYLAWGGNLTPILVAGFKENRQVLDVGRTRRLATKQQRKAIWFRQRGRCANRGCHHPIGEIHHVVDWIHGGRTDLANLAGLCRKCHALITCGRLTMTGTHETGYTFTTSRAGPLARTG